MMISFMMVILIALTVYLFSKAVLFEKTVAVTDEEETLTETIEEIHEKVCQIFNISKQGGSFAGGMLMDSLP